MKHTVRRQSDTPHRSHAAAHGAEKSSTPASAEFMDNRPEAATQRRLADTIHNSPHMVAQRRQLHGLFGEAAQLKDAADEPEFQPSAESVRLLRGKTKGPLDFLSAHSFAMRPKIVQRAMRSVETPNKDNRERTVEGYIDLLEYRKARQEWGNLDKRTLLFERMKTESTQSRWEEAFQLLKQLEPLVAEGDQTASTAGGPIILKPEQQRFIRETAESDFNTAHKLLIQLANDQEMLRTVFGGNVFDLLHARLNMIAIALQLLNYVLHDNILTDDDGKAEASGSLAHNVERGGGSKARLMLTRAYANAPEYERIGTLIHEASHGSPITETTDIVYLRSWAGMAVRGKIALMNADSYKKAALLAQDQESTLKPLKGGDTHKGRLEQLLGWTDFRLSQARSMAHRVRQRAEQVPTTNLFRNIMEAEPELYAMSKVLKLPWREGRDPASRNERFSEYGIKNIDLDLMDMFVNGFSVALGYLDLIDELDVRDNDEPGLVYSGNKLVVTTGALVKRSNAKMGVFLVSQIGGRLPIPKHWKDVFDNLVADLSTKRIQEEGESLKALDTALS